MEKKSIGYPICWHKSYRGVLICLNTENPGTHEHEELEKQKAERQRRRIVIEMAPDTPDYFRATYACIAHRRTLHYDKLISPNISYNKFPGADCNQ